MSDADPGSPTTDDATDAAAATDASDTGRFAMRLSGNQRVRRYAATATRVCFGDGVGLTLFLGSLLFLVLTWRVGTFFNDITLFVPALERLAGGHLSLGTPAQVDEVYPGMYYADGYVYARNYGALAASLPAYWTVSAVGPTAFRALVVLAWSGLLVAVVARVGGHLDRAPSALPFGDRRSRLAVAGAAGAIALAVNAVAFEPIAEAEAASIALTITTMVVAALTGVMLYRVLARRHGTKVGVLAGAVTVFASPVGFWATLPKRHAFTAFFVVLALYALARSRDVDPSARRRRTGPRLGRAGFRAVAYASAGLLAWIHAPEGFTLFAAVAIVDLPTAPRTDRRTLAVIGAALFVALVPFFLTNYAISGNPLEPPRFLRGVGNLDALPGPDAADPGGADGGGGGAGGGDGGGAGGDGGAGGGAAGQPGGQSPGPLFGVDLETLVPSTFLTLLQVGFFRYVDGVQLMVDDLDRMATVFLRWGTHSRNPGSVYFDGGTDLSVLESLPLAAAVLAAPLVHAVRIAGSRTIPRLEDVDPVDAFAVVFSVLIAAMFIHQLPVHVMLTVRYLTPLYPLLIYAAFRQRVVRDALTAHTDYALWGYEAAALFGTPVALGAILLDDGFFPPPTGEVVQTFGLVSLAAAAALGLALLASENDERAGRLAALAFGVAAGVTTTYLLLSAFFLFHFGDAVLPGVEVAASEYANAVFP